MKLVAFFREHLLVQILAIVSLIWIVTIGSIAFLNIRGQHDFVDRLLEQPYHMLLTSIQGVIIDTLSKGDKDIVQAGISEIARSMPDLDIFIYNTDRRITFAHDKAMTGKALSSVIQDNATLEEIRSMLVAGHFNLKPFYGEGNHQSSLIASRPVMNDSRCLGCHESSQKVLGGITLRVSTDQAIGSLPAIQNHIIMIACLVLVAALLVFYFLFRRLINRPLYHLLDAAAKLEEGDFTHTIDVKGRNEISHICARMNIVNDSLRKMVREVMIAVETLASSSSDLSVLSKQMSLGAKQTSSMADSVTASAEGMNFNIHSVAAAIEQTSTNVGMMAESTEGMTAVIHEIAKNSENARVITGQAVVTTTKASEKVDELGKVARQISKITETITKISEKTNLLALNATIEAARAGESGKGFAVVANEVKTLARQTAEATEDIERQIGGMQDSTQNTVLQIGEISKVIHDVNEIITSIAAAVEEQSVTTKEIARSVAHASEGIMDINENVGQTSTVAEEIAKDITEVNTAARDITNSSVHVQMSSEELLMLTDQLRETIGKFRV
ncbi:MAG: methyl-accepting chemotaxis protein [Deltaproteobacteria bacterium]|nr:methyl-accepting chemotaxis protein [Deltaproteobacteria bacterium]